MKKLILLLVLVMAFGLAGCSSGSDDDVIVITERFFVNEMTEIFLNHQQYLGRTIQYEGMFRTSSWAGEYFSFVYRNVPGCCSPTEILGFELVMDGFESFEDNAWVEVTGVLEHDGQFILLRVVDILELDERGAETVS